MPEQINVKDSITGRVAVIQFEAIINRTKYEEEKKARVENYTKYWSYYNCEQYDEENNKVRQSLNLKANQKLPEHLRRHSYTGVIPDGVDFITDQLMEDLGIEVKSNKEIASQESDKEQPEEQILFQNIWDGSDMELEAPDLTREAIVSAESYILLKWDEASKIVKMIPYDAESITPVYSQNNYKKIVMVDIDQSEYDDMENRDVKRVDRYILGQTSEGFQECVLLRYTEDKETPDEARLLNIPFIPIIHLRAVRTRVRQSFGDSLVKKITGDADRYNAVNQLEYLISRYNSISHLATFGTESKITPEQLYLGGEVNDFWNFPNTIDLKVITLPTDPILIENQKNTLENQMYKKMGLQRMDLADFQGFGAPSGYSLEIINRRTNGVFSRIRKELAKGYTEVFDKAIDMQAIMESGKPWYIIEPLKIYPNRTIKFTFGSIFVADREQIRQDYVAGLTSRKRALMAQGKSELEAQTISAEVDEEKANENASELEGVTNLLKNRK